MFLCMSKINFIIHSFLEILHLKEFYWLTAFWLVTREAEFFQIRFWWWNTSNKIWFNFRLSPGKTNEKTSQKIQKTYFGAILLRFRQKRMLQEKSALSVFKYSDFPPSCKNLEKTNNDPFLIEMLASPTDGQTDNSDFIGPSVGPCSN